MQKVERAGLVWREGRFSWPFVAIVAYLAAAVFSFDLAWRIAKMPITELLAISAGVFAVTSALLFIMIRVMSRRAQA